MVKIEEALAVRCKDIGTEYECEKAGCIWIPRARKYKCRQPTTVILRRPGHKLITTMQCSSSRLTPELLEVLKAQDPIKAARLEAKLGEKVEVCE